ncbi:hypothetical protein RKLH11_3791 [Rhodobacteraceae bacterium KLH11]|nr:hypothetical protein RKLH11_3791 [Rhodobacteraceae bacterium KLH11]
MTASRPTCTRTDARVRTLVYHPDEVYKIDVSRGYALSIHLQDGEQMVDEVRGDPKTWDFIPLTAGNGFVLKAKHATTQASNLILQTNLRSYVFLLQAHEAGPPDNVGFLYRFSYPDQKKGFKPRQAGNIQTAFNTKQMGKSSTASQVPNSVQFTCQTMWNQTQQRANN